MRCFVSIYDSKAEIWLDPWVVTSRAAAARQFHSQVNDERNTMLNQYPEDYTLFCLGEFDDRTGEIKPLGAPESIVNGLVLFPAEESASVTPVKARE